MTEILYSPYKRCGKCRKSNKNLWSPPPLPHRPALTCLPFLGPPVSVASGWGPPCFISSFCQHGKALDQHQARGVTSWLVQAHRVPRSPKRASTTQSLGPDSLGSEVSPPPTLISQMHCGVPTCNSHPNARFRGALVAFCSSGGLQGPSLEGPLAASVATYCNCEVFQTQKKQRER